MNDQNRKCTSFHDVRKYNMLIVDIGLFCSKY